MLLIDLAIGAGLALGSANAYTAAAQPASPGGIGAAAFAEWTYEAEFFQNRGDRQSSRQGNRSGRQTSRQGNQSNRQTNRSDNADQRTDAYNNRTETRADAYNNRTEARSDAVSNWNGYYAARPVGYRVNVLPASYNRVVVAGAPYYYSSGVYYSRVGGAYVVVAAPVGARLTILPQGYRAVVWAGTTFYYVNDTYYVTAPGGRGYVVVAKPAGIVVTP